MKIQNVWLVAMLVVLFQTHTSHASLCDACKEMFFIQSIGTCSRCNGTTSSGSFKLCKKCSDQLEQCEACQKSLKAKADEAPREVNPPVPEKPGPKTKAYPAHWGAPPRVQTKDLRPLPGGYGMGSSTLKGWIQKNLDQDAKAAQAGGNDKAADAAKAEEIQQVEKKIAGMEDLAKRARFTEEGLKKHQEELAALKERLKVLQGESKAK
jgi:hypothetical protein